MSEAVKGLIMLLLQKMNQWELVGSQACGEIPIEKKKKIIAIYLHCLPGIWNLRQVRKTHAKTDDGYCRMLSVKHDLLSVLHQNGFPLEEKYPLAFWSILCKRNILISTPSVTVTPLPSPFYKLLTKRQEDSNCATANWPLWSFLNSPEKFIGFR